MRRKIKIKSPKLMAFTPQSDFVPRAIVEQLVIKQEDLERVVLLIAPAGYGKSTVMAQLYRRLKEAESAVCWLSLDSDDDEPTRFVSFLTETIGEVVEGFGDELKAALNTEGDFSVNTIALMMFENLAASDIHISVFLDDYHVITDEKIHQLIRMLVKYCGEQLRFVIASRSDTPIGLGELRSKGLVLELDLKDLSLSPEEAREMIKRKGRGDLDEPSIDLICKQTEGWAVGIQLLCLAGDGASKPLEIFTNFTNRDKNIDDYLGDMVLDRLPDEERKFLLHTSIFERLDASLCEAILPDCNGQQFLEKMVAKGLFLLPLDREQKWFRYHHLFAEFLRTRLDRDYAGATLKLNATVARWYLDRGEIEVAIKYGLLAEDYEFTAPLIADYARVITQIRGRHGIFLRWLKALPQNYKDKWPEIKIGYAWSLTFTDEHKLAEQELNGLEALQEDFSQTATTSDAFDQIKQSCEMIRCVIEGLSGRHVVCAKRAQIWLKKWPDATDFNLGTVGNAYSYSCNSLRQIEEGFDVVADAKAAFRRSNSSYGAGWASAIEGMLHISNGDFSKARSLLEEGVKIAEEAAGPYSQVVSILSLILSETLYEQGELVEARRHVDRGWRALQEVASMEFLLIGYSVSAKILNAEGQQMAALKLLDEGRAFGETQRLPRLYNSLALEGYSMLLVGGDLDRAQSYLKSSGIEKLDGDAQSFEAHIVKSANARKFIAEREYKKAIPLINSLLTEYRAQNREGLLMSTFALKAAALFGLGVKNEAMRFIEQALIIGSRERIVRRFLDDNLIIRDVMLEFLSRRRGLVVAISDIPADYIQDLCKVFDVDAVPDAQKTEKILVESLSKKEKQILLLTEQGLTNRQIADALFVSEKTIKWHLQNIFGKLYVKNRTSAALKARKLSLL